MTAAPGEKKGRFFVDVFDGKGAAKTSEESSPGGSGSAPGPNTLSNSTTVAVNASNVPAGTNSASGTPPGPVSAVQNAAGIAGEVKKGRFSVIEKLGHTQQGSRSSSQGGAPEERPNTAGATEGN
jgi:hypothetical protein